MVRFCPYCGRNLPSDAKMCLFCEKTLAMHDDMVYEPYNIEQKTNDKKINKRSLLVFLVASILIIAAVAISTTVYFFLSGKTDESPQIIPIPNIHFTQYTTDNKLTVTMTGSENLQWMDFTVSCNVNYSLIRSNGTVIYQQTDLGNWTYTGVHGLELGDQFILDDAGTITITHKPTNTLFGPWTFN
jgi:magnesium-transporting ATPase (P-type)